MSNYYIADPVPMKTDNEWEIEDAFNDWDRDLESKYSVYEIDYRHVKTATDRLLIGDYTLMDYEAYKFYYKTLIYKHKCVLDELDEYETLHPDMCDKAREVLDKIKKSHEEYLKKYNSKLNMAEGILKHDLTYRWSKLNPKDEIENYDAKRLSATEKLKN